MRTLFALLLTSGMAAANPLPKADATFPEPDMEAIRLGQLLFYDPILSGNKTVSCATCHHPRFATSDGVSLGLGDGGVGLGPERDHDPENPPEQRIPRNSPALFNLGASEFQTFFHDGRLQADSSRATGLRTPLGEDMERGFDSALAAQAMFPVLSPDEMAGHYSENDVSTAVRRGLLTGEGGAWDILANRVEKIPEYRTAFDLVIGAKTIEFTDIANVIADFIAFEWRSDDSPFDRFLRGEEELTDNALAGLNLFYGAAGCSTCHAGQFQTDHKFHAIAMPQIGPGKAARFERHNRDTGRMRVTGDPADAYAFRTPSLRNVTETAPYGHSGAYRALRQVILHHVDPVQSLSDYDTEQSVLPGPEFDTDWVQMNDPKEQEAIAAASGLTLPELGVDDVDALLAFLETLSDPVALEGRLGIPEVVPSGLPVER